MKAAKKNVPDFYRVSMGAMFHDTELIKSTERLAPNAGDGWVILSVPEPSSGMLLVAGLAALAVMRRRRA